MYGLINGRIYTVSGNDWDLTPMHAMAVDDNGDIAAVGTNEEIIEYINELYKTCPRISEKLYKADGNFQDDIKEHIKSKEDGMFAHFADGYENEDLHVLDDLIPYIFHFHFKLFEMTEDGEYSVDYKSILEYLHERNYDGYVSTEYEGNRWTLPDMPMVEKEQVLLHQKYIRDCLA